MKLRIASFKKIGMTETLEEFVYKEGLGAGLELFDEKELINFLERTKSKEKTQLDKYKHPYIHKSKIYIINEKGKKYDLNSLKNEIMKRPEKILQQNEKMKHSAGVYVFYNLGLPALKGLIINEGKLSAGKKGDFIIVNTCPGAGVCKTYCYAKKGGYVQWAASSINKSRLLNFLVNDPNGFKNKFIEELKKLEKKDEDVVIRWHDAGDIFSKDYKKMAYEIANLFPTIKFYAYTKMADIALSDKPKNFIVTFSEGSLPRESKKIEKVLNIKKSVTVPFELFEDLYLKKGKKLVKKDGVNVFIKNGLDTLKDRMVKKYKIEKETLLNYPDLLKKPEGKELKWDVIVIPGHGDISAIRNDVRTIYLLEH